MNFLTNSKARLSAISLAALILVACGSIWAAGAGAASSGGVSMSGGGTSTGDAPAPNGRVNDRYSKIWVSQVKPAEKRWAYRTAQCESGGDPHAIGGGGIYRGAFQFMKSTWRASPKSPGGDPIAFSYRTQAVVAVMLMRRDGTGHWPVCGH
jgi:hypothetical protein